ncbi:hypothetical protein F5Y10DRAFT_251893 [Nemania abortiva]|nr:hypothetical protein F5Y10DRAFT_251893 [Nemania abortiva]
MSSSPCAQGFDISSQQDISTKFTELRQCYGDVGPPFVNFINIDSPTTDLAFPARLWTQNVTVTGFQNLLLNLSGAQSVEALYIEDFYNASLVLPFDDYLSTVGAVVLNSSNQATEVERQVNVYGNATGQWIQTNGSYTTLHDIEFLDKIYAETSQILSFPKLSNVIYLESNAGNFYFPQLSVASNATFTSHIIPANLPQSLQVTHNLTIRHNGGERFTSLKLDGTVTSDYEWNIQSVGTDFVVSEISNATIILSNLTSVGNSLWVNNSVNSTFAFPDLRNVGTLVMEGNGNSPLPGDLRSLEFADSIVLKGPIDTSSSGNIFPSLKLVKGSVTIEVWNDDFNCSKLVSQQMDGLIGHLSCNGTDINMPVMPSQAPQTGAANKGLSQGAWAGIGVGIAIFVIGLAALLIWAFLYFRSRIRQMEKQHTSSDASHTTFGADESAPRQSPVEANGHKSFNPVELYGTRSPVEVDASTLPSEVP